MTEVTRPGGENLVPSSYRGVAVADVDFPLEESSLVRHFLGREAYRRTRFVVARHRGACAVVAVRKADSVALFAPITEATVLVTSDACEYLYRPDVDTAVPSSLCRAALEDAPGARGVVVEGRYGHISFIVDPAPLRLRVRDVVPPAPPKLVDQVRRLLDVAEHQPPVEVQADLVDLTAKATARAAPTYLFPCRGGELSIPGAEARYLDERPPFQEAVLVGCERSQQIHTWFYGSRAADQIDICPRSSSVPPGPVLTRCCLLERGVTEDEGQVVVPWGASLSEVSDALTLVTRAWEPAWAPA
jgi:hypothetical protein